LPDGVESRKKRLESVYRNGLAGRSGGRIETVRRTANTI